MARRVVLAMLAMLAVLAFEAGDPTRAAAPVAPAVIVAELFTSEGCSSCPPADLLLQALADGSLTPGIQVITLSEHVDYWDDLGWKDPFSARVFSDRQSAYAARQFDSGRQVYTPELLVDGRTAVIGSDRDAVRNAVMAAAKTAKLPLTVSATRSTDGRTIRAHVHGVGVGDAALKRSADLVLAVTESRLVTDVKRGENGGRRLSHTSVVRSLATLATLSAGDRPLDRDVTVNWDSAWTAANVGVVALLQERGSLHVVAAASAPVK